jgi:hypothetical protein
LERDRFVQPAERRRQVAEIAYHGGILRREFESAAVFRFGSGEIEIDLAQNRGLCQMRLGEVRIQSERALRRGTGFCDRLLSFLRRNADVAGE